MIFLYFISIRFYLLGIKLAAITGNDKARKWLNGRKNIFEQITALLKTGEERVWFHCSSLGEFEQGRPVMEKLRMQHASLKIVLTFFSPSGYEVRKNYKEADYIFYLPNDTYANAGKFINLIQPGKVFFVKYDYWYHYFSVLKSRNIPLYMVSAIFRSNQPFFKWYGSFFRRILNCVTHFFVQDESSKKLLELAGFKNVTVSGDTRFDRVASIASESKQISLVEKFKNGKRLFIAGSTWPQDEEIVSRLIEKHPAEIEPGGCASCGFEKFIIAPHEISPERIQSLYSKLTTKLTPQNVVLFSKADEASVAGSFVLIIDNMGMLSSLYRYAEVAFIGGGFGKGIHNTLEAAVFGIPVFFGPNYKKFKEAEDLVQAGGAFPINNFDELQAKLTPVISDEERWLSVSAISKNYVKEKTGATDRILQFTGTTSGK